MALLLAPNRVRKKWTYGVGKHAGETIDEVAEGDPSYLQWTWKQAIPEEAARAIEECAEAHDFDLTRE